MMSATVPFTPLPQLPVPEINSVDIEFCLLPEYQRNSLLKHFTSSANQKINKRELSKLRLPYKFTVLIHNKEIYVRHLRAGKGSYGVVKFLWNVRTHEWFVMKIVSEQNDNCLDISYELKVNTITAEHDMLRECNMAEAVIGTRVSPKKGKQTYFVMPVKYGIELYVYHAELLASAAVRAHPHHALNRYAQVCLIVHDLHAKGILHRDVKPENMILDIARNQLALIDFGCAAHLPTGKDVLIENLLRGTTFTLAPEILERNQDFQYSVLTDRFSVGVVIGESARFTTTDNQRPARLITPQNMSPIEKKLFAICDRLMHHDPVNRLPLDQAAAELEALHALVDTPLKLGFVNLPGLLLHDNLGLNKLIKDMRKSCDEIVMLAPADFKITPMVFSVMQKMHLVGLRAHDKIFHTDNQNDIIRYLQEQEPLMQRKSSRYFSCEKQVVRQPEKPVMVAPKPNTNANANANANQNTIPPGKLTAAHVRQFQAAAPPPKKTNNTFANWFTKKR